VLDIAAVPFLDSTGAATSTASCARPRATARVRYRGTLADALEAARPLDALSP
jgi:hypothetical protein